VQGKTQVMSSCCQDGPPPVRLPSGELGFAERTLVMGVINMTPDSFSGDGLSNNVAVAVRQARNFATAGADLIDIGGQSTRPGSRQISAAEELDRVIPTIEAVRAEVDVPISVDTSVVEVAEQALEAGAEMINDVCALRGEGMAELAAQAGVPVVIMHMQGTPGDMQDNPTYEDVITDISDFLARRIEAAVAAGIEEKQIIVDPGFGFGKTVEHNYGILNNLDSFKSFGLPILVGLSRKSMINKVLKIKPENALNGTTVLNTIALLKGADILRVHDVKEAVEVIKIVSELNECD
ncbi:MAG: dihydropteroate synthase, partial [Bacteroidales bacterium]|nr:dihydropteroate synthase [Bacteroidales bacterium]